MQVVVSSSNILRLQENQHGLLILSFNTGYLSKTLILPGIIWSKLTTTSTSNTIHMVLLGSLLNTSSLQSPIPSAPTAQNTSYNLMLD